MNPNTTAQRKTTKTAGKTNGRPRGAVAHILDGTQLAAAARKVLTETRPDLAAMLIDTVTVEHDGKLLIAVDDNRPAVLDREGVGCFAKDGTIGVLVEADFNVFWVDIPTEAIAAAITPEAVDLADAIRVFGARLDSNHFQWYSAYTGTYQP